MTHSKRSKNRASHEWNERFQQMEQALSTLTRQISHLLRAMEEKNGKVEDRPEAKKIPEPQKRPRPDETPLQRTEPPKSVPTETCGNRFPLPVVQVSEFLQKMYEFRCNQLTGQTEYRPRSGTEPSFRPVCPRAKSTFYYEVQAAGIFCYESQVQCFLNSFRIQGYHPFRTYMEGLPAWDGKDRIDALARRVSEEALWRTGFRRWMLGMTAGWMGVNPQYANSLAPLLVSREQGLHKSTFCKILLPPELARYYTDSFPLAQIPQAEQKLTGYGLISLDEFDRHSSRRQADLKNLMQTTTLHLRRSRQAYETTLPRIASFIGTSNCKELLTDKTGSRRFLCIEVKRMIDTDTPLEYEQLYAQLKYLLTVAGEPYWPTAEEKSAIEQQNQAFYKSSVEENLFHETFQETERGTPGALLLSAEEIFCRLKRYNPAAMRGRIAGNFGKLLAEMGVTRIRLNTGNRYCVIPREAAT